MLEVCQGVSESRFALQVKITAKNIFAQEKSGETHYLCLSGFASKHRLKIMDECVFFSFLNDIETFWSCPPVEHIVCLTGKML